VLGSFFIHVRFVEIGKSLLKLVLFSFGKFIAVFLEQNKFNHLKQFIEGFFTEFFAQLIIIMLLLTKEVAHNWILLKNIVKSSSSVIKGALALEILFALRHYFGNNFLWY